MRRRVVLSAASFSELVRSAIVPAAAMAIAIAPAAVRAQGLADDGAAPRADEARSGRDEAPAARRSSPNPVRTRAEKDRAYRVVVSLEERRLWVISQQDTIMSAPVAVGSGARLSGLGNTWVFQTPKGVRTVQRKVVNPVWTPPDWMYVETAKENGLRVMPLKANKPYTLRDGRKLVIRNGYVGVLVGTRFYPVPVDEHIVWDDILFIPPMGTKNRRVERELGRYALDTGNGYLLHGTPYEDTIGQNVSHGCVRLHDEDITWLHQYVPVGTRVYVF